MSPSIKKPEDIILLRIGGERLARVVATTAALVVPGVSLLALNQKADDLIRETGDIPSFLGYKPEGAHREYPASICISVNDEIVHGIPNESPHDVKEGDIVSLDCGLTHQGLITDHAVSVVAGASNPETDRLLRATKEALEAGIRASRGGNHVGDIGDAISKVARSYNYGNVIDLGGHGVGYVVHEEPYIMNEGEKGEGEELVPGMVIAIEPMLTEGTAHIRLLPDDYTYVTRDSSRSAHFEHTILITDGAPEILTKLP